MSRKLISEALVAQNIVSFKANSFKLSPLLFIVSKKSSTSLISHTKLNLGFVGLLLNIQDKSVKTLGCSPTYQWSRGMQKLLICNLQLICNL